MSNSYCNAQCHPEKNTSQYFFYLQRKHVFLFFCFQKSVFLIQHDCFFRRGFFFAKTQFDIFVCSLICFPLLIFFYVSCIFLSYFTLHVQQVKKVLAKKWNVDFVVFFFFFYLIFFFCPTYVLIKKKKKNRSLPHYFFAMFLNLLRFLKTKKITKIYARSV